MRYNFLFLFTSPYSFITPFILFTFTSGALCPWLRQRHRRTDRLRTERRRRADVAAPHQDGVDSGRVDGVRWME